MDALVETENLSRRYNDRVVVDGLNLTLKRGEILGLLGPNGAGKSTTLRMLTGDLAPTGGTLRIAGIDLQHHPVKAKQQLGYLPEKPPLLPDQRVDEFLWDCARLRRIPQKLIQDRVEQAKRQCGLQASGRRLIRNLSKGFQQRVGIAQAIQHQPAVIILDEPTDGLDPAQKNEVRRLIQQLAQDAAVILSSHILPEIQSVCQRVIILNEGRTVYAGDIRPPACPRLKLALNRNVDESALAGLAPVAAVERLHTDYFRVTLEDGADASQLAAQVVEQGWELKQLTPEEHSLEQIFLEATSGTGP